MLHFRSKPLPEVAEKFLTEFGAGKAKNTVNLYRAALHHFYRFLAQSKIDLAKLQLEHVGEFDEDLARHNLKFVTRRATLQHVHKYLRWLEDAEVLASGFSSKLFPNYKPECYQGRQATLPELAEQFLQVLSATKKPATVNGYKSGLRTFYKHHFKTGKPPYKINRQDIDAFLINLKDNDVNVNNRGSRLAHFRRYLDWLHDHRKLKTHPDELIKSEDFPRRDKTLPKPFPVDVDLEIQQRLNASNEIDWLGLLLMRRCGLRVGELRNLTTDCVDEDFNGNWFLKVPLGKMNNERVIPLDPVTVDLVKRIQMQHSQRPEPGTNVHYLISNPQGRRRSRNHFGHILTEVTKGLAIPGKANLHRLRHSFATSLLSAGISLNALKVLLGHRDIRMTLGYAAVTQEAVRSEFFTALNKIHIKYETPSYSLRTPDLREGMNQSIYDAQRFVKKFIKDNGISDQQKLNRLLARLMTVRQEISNLLALSLP
jgi:site-specific recombinase XerD